MIIAAALLIGALVAQQPARPVDSGTIRQMARNGWRATGEKAVGWLWEAAYAGDAKVLGALVAAGADASSARDDGTTILMAAAVSGDAECVRLLIAAGADPTSRDGSGRNAADRVRDAMNSGPGAQGARSPARRAVSATGRPPQYELILKLLADE